MKFILKLVHIPGSGAEWDNLHYRAEIYDKEGRYIISARDKFPEDAKKAAIEAYHASQETFISSEEIDL